MQSRRMMTLEGLVLNFFACWGVGVGADHTVKAGGSGKTVWASADQQIGGWGNVGLNKQTFMIRAHQRMPIGMRE